MSKVFARYSLIWATTFFSAFYLLYFSPALLQGRILAPSDAYNFYFPAFAMPWKLWEPNIFAGYPVFADPQFFTWYPLRWLAPNYNVFVISAFVAASSLTCGYVYWKLQSVTAALAAGIIFGSGSFMVAHLGHASMVHSAAWLPLAAWSIEGFARNRHAGWLLTGTAALALSLLGGHPQVTTHVFLLTGLVAARALFMLRQEGTGSVLRVGLGFAAMAVVAVALCAVQILPFVEFSAMSNRAEWSYGQFVAFGMRLRELPTIISPYLFGGAFGLRWSVLPGPTEASIFAGTGTLLLAGLSFMGRRKGDDVWFWAGIAALSLLVATAGYNGLGRIFYLLPVISGFRAPARIGVLFIFAASILAAYGIKRLQERALSDRDIAKATLVFASVSALLIVITILSKAWTTEVVAAGASRLVAVGPVATTFAAILAMAGLALLTKRPPRSVIAASLLALISVDVGQFGWFYEWRASPFNATVPSGFGNRIPSEWEQARQGLAGSNGRTLLMQTPLGYKFLLHPNLNLLHGVATANGYGPLAPRAFELTTGIGVTGAPTSTPSQALLSVLALAAIIYPNDPRKAVQIGACTHGPATTFTVPLQQPVSVSQIQIVSQLDCAASREGGDIAAHIQLDTADGVLAVPLLVGRDTSVWDHDRQSAAARVKHPKATVESSFKDGATAGYRYSAWLSLGETEPVLVSRITIAMPSDKEGILGISRIDLKDEVAGTTVSLGMPDLAFGQGSATRQDIGDDTIILSGIPSRKNPLGMAWLVAETQTLQSEAAARAVREGRLPDGRDFDPARMAVVEKPVQLDAVAPSDFESTVTRTAVDERSTDFDISSAMPGLLFISQSYHPGWMATVNGQEAEVLRTNGAFQGVRVPAGRSRVELRFDPASYKLGAAISLVAAIVLVSMAPVDFYLRRRRRR